MEEGWTLGLTFKEANILAIQCNQEFFPLHNRGPHYVFSNGFNVAVLANPNHLVGTLIEDMEFEKVNEETFSIEDIDISINKERNIITFSYQQEVFQSELFDGKFMVENTSARFSKWFSLK